MIGFLSGSGGNDQAAQTVYREQQKTYHATIGPQPSIAQRIETRFEHVCKCGHFIETKGAAAALDGMGRAENAIEQVQVARTLLQREKALLHHGDVLAALLEECRLEFRQIDAHCPSLVVRET